MSGPLVVLTAARSVAREIIALADQVPALMDEQVRFRLLAGRVRPLGCRARIPGRPLVERSGVRRRSAAAAWGGRR